MTEKPIYFDADCFSCFLLVNQEMLLSSLYPKRIHLPFDVYHELTHPGFQLSKNVVAICKTLGIVVEYVIMDSPEVDLYNELCFSPLGGYRRIGRGEASAIVLAKYNDGILASNNMRDISHYVRRFNLSHLTTGVIFCEALNKGLITEEDCNANWKQLIGFGRRLPTITFSKYRNEFYLKGII